MGNKTNAIAYLHRAPRMILFFISFWLAIQSPPVAAQDQFAVQPVRSIIVDDQGVIWAATDEGVAKVDKVDKDYYLARLAGKVPSKKVFSLFIDQDGHLLAGTGRGAFRLRSRQGEEFEPFFSKPQPQKVLEKETIRAISQNAGGVFCFGTDSGLFCASADDDDVMAMAGAPSPVHALFHDLDGVLWLGTPGGLFSCSSDLLEFREELSGRGVHFVRSVSGRLLVGTDSGLLQQTGKAFSPFLGELTGVAVWDLQDQANLGRYVISSAAGLFEFDGSDKLTPLELQGTGFDPKKVRAIAQTQSGDFVLGLDNGLWISPPLSPPLDPYLEILEVARKDLESGNFGKAEEGFRKLLQPGLDRPYQKEALVGLADIHFEVANDQRWRGELEVALETVDDGLELHRTDKLEALRQELVETIGDLRIEAIASNRRRALQNARLDIDGQRWDAAIQKLNLVLEYDEQLERRKTPEALQGKQKAYLGKGAALEKAGNISAAIGVYMAALSDDVADAAVFNTRIAAVRERQEIRAWFDSGLQNLRRNNWQAAISDFQRVQSKDPEFPTLAENLSAAYSGRGQASSRQGRSLLQQGKGSTDIWRNAQSDFEKALVQTPDNPEVNRLLKEAKAEEAYVIGLEALQQGSWDAASEAFQQALAHNQDHQGAQQGVAEVVSRRNYQAALESLRRTADRQGSSEAQEALNRINQEAIEQEAIESPLEQIRQNRLARLDLEAASKPYLDGLDAVSKRQWDNAQFHLGRALDKLKGPTLEELPRDSLLGALAEVLESVALDRLNLARDGNRRVAIEKALEKGNSCLEQENWECAKEAFTQVRAFSPNDSDAVSGLRRVAAEEMRQADEAKRQADEAWQMFLTIIGLAVVLSVLVPLFAYSRTRGGIFAFIRYKTGAIRAYEKALTSNPTLKRALLKLVDLNRKNPDRLLEFCERYLKNKGDDVEVQLEMAGLLLEKRSFKAALDALHQILRLECNPKQREKAFEKLARIHQESPRQDFDIPLYEKALSSSSNSPALNDLLSRLYLREERRDEKALELYSRTLDAQRKPLNVRMCLILAQGHLDAGRHEAAIRQAEAVLEQEPGNQRALRALFTARHETGALDHGSLDLKNLLKGAAPLTILDICERLVEWMPEFKGKVVELYSRTIASLQKKAKDAPELLLLKTQFHAHLCTATHPESPGHLDDDWTAASDFLEQAYLAGKAEGFKAKDFLDQLIRAYERMLGVGPDEDPSSVFRLADLYGRADRWTASLGRLRELMQIPEWNQQSSRALRKLLDEMSLPDLAGKFFEDAGWQVDNMPPSCRLEDNEKCNDRLLISGQSVKAFAEMGNALIRSFPEFVSIDDAVKLAEYVRQYPECSSEVAFLVFTGHLRREVSGYLYALMTGTAGGSPLTIVPLNAEGLKDAIIENKSEKHLVKQFHTWSGKGDLYDERNPISDAASFFGRQELTARIVEIITKGQNFAIFGLRKMGKTSFVFQLRESLDSTLVGYVDLQYLSPKNGSSPRSEEVYSLLLQEIHEQIRLKMPQIGLRRLTDSSANQEHSTSGDDFRDALNSLKKAFDKADQEFKVVLILDEVELMLPKVKKQEAESGAVPADGEGIRECLQFFRLLRGMSQQSGFIVSGVVGADPTALREGYWGPHQNPVYAYYKEILLSPLEKEECNEMVQSLGQLMGVDYDAPSLEMIYRESGGHPFVARQLCSRLVNRNNERPLHVSTDLVKAASSDFIDHRGHDFRQILYGHVSSQGRSILEQLAREDDRGLDSQDLFELARLDASKRQPWDEVLKDLQSFHLIVQEEGLLRIQMPLFRRWIRRNLGIDDSQTTLKLVPQQPQAEAASIEEDYCVTEPVKNPALFQGRSEELEEMLEDVRYGDSFAIVGSSKSGKSSLLLQLEQGLLKALEARSRGDEFIAPLLVRPLKATETSARIYQEIADGLKQQVVPRLAGEMKARDAVFLDQEIPEEMAFPAFCGMLSQLVESTQPHLRLVILLDDLDNVLSCKWSNVFFNNLRHLVSQSELVDHVGVVVTGTVAIYSLFKQPGSPFLNVINSTKSLRPLSKAESERLIRGAGKRISQGTVDHVFDQTGGHPFIIQYIMCHLHQGREGQRSGKITRQGVDQAIEAFLQEHADLMQFDQTAESVYRFIRESGEARKSEIIERLGDSETANNALEVLLQSAAIYEQPRSHYRIGGQIFLTWFQRDDGDSDSFQAVAK